MRIVITGGGTGGHVSPAVAVIDRLRERSAQAAFPLELLYVGSASGVERQTMSNMGVPYSSIQTGKLRRYLSLQTPLDLFVRLPVGFFQALGKVSRFRPDVIFSTGGYVCVPTVIAGRLLRVPSLTHEQTALVGLANRIAGRFATRVAISFPRSGRYFPPHKTLLTGNPVRLSVLTGDAQGAASVFGFDSALPTLYVTGGAQGSHAINMAVRDALPRLLVGTKNASPLQVIHQCGQGPDGTGADLQMLQETRDALPPEQRARYRVQAYVGEELGDIYALCSLVLGRAGAGTLNELANLGKPSILVPLPGAAGGEQEANARTMENAGGTYVLLENALTPDMLADTIQALIADPDKLSRMGQGAARLAMPGAADAIVDELLRLAGG